MVNVGNKRIVLQVWIGSEPSSDILGMMTDTSKMPGYLLISDQNFIGAKKWKSAKSYCRNPVVKKYVDAVKAQEYTVQMKNTMISDFIRFHFASENKNVLYMDCDCVMKKEPIICGAGPFFVGTQTRYIHDMYAFYSKSTEYFFDLISAAIHKLSYTAPYVQVFINTINGSDEQVRTMNRTCFNHLNRESWVS